MMKEGASREGVRVLVVEHSRVGLSDAVYALVIVHVLTLEEVQPGTDLPDFVDCRLLKLEDSVAFQDS